MILAVDTSLGTAVALIDADGERRAEAAAVDPLGHAEVIGDLLVRVLSEAGGASGEAGDTEITHVITGMGPGPFTGLRIGIAAARAFALGRDLPVIPVPSHLAAALTALDTETAPFAIVTDARRREVAITVFDGLDDDGIPAVVADTVLVRAADADAHLDGIRRIDVSTLSATDLARVGARALAAGRTLAGEEPLYMRHPDVTLPGAPKKVGT
ncbi:tRNA (adenosine(37)-N6)-threonylcarbamoyltransferase complex dimerization subunit type 1 TsaB [Microbacterium sp. 2RAF4]|uniref:tRNA (adenosine(37)-N6)-threonylcarbamoyltransferase complex dimerization subunit type 1 TsaB n=1 Tax=Microbacterium sp. 2RAF4 TaxID=3232999 RepID=UPI003F99C3B9